MSKHHSHPRTVCQTSIRQRLLRVERIDWDSGGSSFDIYDQATGVCLTDAESLDTLPGPEQLAGLLDDLCPNAFNGEHDSCQITSGGEGRDGFCSSCADRPHATGDARRSDPRDTYATPKGTPIHHDD